jgi:hypothetical protein
MESSEGKQEAYVLSTTLLHLVIVLSLYLQSGVPFSSYSRGKEKLPPIQPRYVI